MRDAQATLFHPFREGLLEAPEGSRCLFIGAQLGLAPPADFRASFSLVQGFKPYFNALQQAGYEVSPTIPAGEAFDLALVLCGRHRRLNELWIAEALENARAEALILVAGSKDDGISSLRKRVGELIEIEGSESKYHGNVFWFRRPSDFEAVADTLCARNRESLVDGRFLTLPGMFSHGEIDPGSRLLVEHLPADLGGTVADFCAGWGYLSVELAKRAPDIRRIDLYEADYASLQAARTNLAGAAEGKELQFFWHDLVGEPVRGRYDAIAMNPPFHMDRAADPKLGEALIRVAAGALRPGGELLMVANRQLPYEATLQKSFSRLQKLTEEQGFKIFRARR